MGIINLKTVDKSSPSPYHNSRGGAKIDSIIIHSTGTSSFQGTVHGFMSNPKHKSTHFIISREGVIKQMVDPSQEANHGGGYRLKPANFNAINQEFIRKFGGSGIPVVQKPDDNGVLRDMIPKSNINGDFKVNTRSIGIELMNAHNNVEQFTRTQLQALEGLIAALIVQFPDISIDHIYGHIDVSRDPDAKDYGVTTYGHTDRDSDHTDPKPNFPFADVKEAIIELLHEVDTPTNANFTSPEGLEMHLRENALGQSGVTINANMNNSNASGIHYGADSCQVEQSQHQANTSMPDGTSVYHGNDSQGLNSENIDSNINTPHGAAFHYSANINQVNESEQFKGEANTSLPDGTTLYHGIDSSNNDQVGNSNQTVSKVTDISLADGTTNLQNTPDHSQQSHSTNSNVNPTDGNPSHDGNNIQSGQPNENHVSANTSMPDGTVVHYDADSCKIVSQTLSDQSAHTQIDMHQNQSVQPPHDDGNQSIPHQ